MIEWKQGLAIVSPTGRHHSINTDDHHLQLFAISYENVKQTNTRLSSNLQPPLLWRLHFESVKPTMHACAIWLGNSVIMSKLDCYSHSHVKTLAKDKLAS